MFYSFLFCLRSFADETKTEQGRPSVTFIIKWFTFWPRSWSHWVFPTTNLHLLAEGKRIRPSLVTYMCGTLTHRISLGAILIWTSLRAPAYCPVHSTWLWACWSTQGNALNGGTNNVTVLLFTAPQKLLPARDWLIILLPWDLLNSRVVASGTEQ